MLSLFPKTLSLHFQFGTSRQRPNFGNNYISCTTDQWSNMCSKCYIHTAQSLSCEPKLIYSSFPIHYMIHAKAETKQWETWVEIWLHDFASVKPTSKKLRSSLAARQVRNPASLLLWHGFDPQAHMASPQFFFFLDVFYIFLFLFSRKSVSWYFSKVMLLCK